jgi:hypothetical protein
VCVCVYQVSNNKTFRLEEIPAEELEVGEGELLVPVAHFNKEVYTTFGSPFILNIKQVIPPPPPQLHARFRIRVDLMRIRIPHFYNC